MWAIWYNYTHEKCGGGGCSCFLSSRLLLVWIFNRLRDRPRERLDERQQHLVLVRALLLDEVVGDVLHQLGLPRVVGKSLVLVMRL